MTPPARPVERGFALLSVLWAIGLLSAIALVMLRVSHSDVRRLQVDLALAQAQASADGAVRLAILEALTDSDQVLWDGVPRQQGDGLVTRQDLAGLVDLNSAPPSLLTGLLRQAGVAPDRQQSLASAILGSRGNAAETRPFYSTLDLLRVPGVTPPLLRRLLPFVTVYSGAAGIDPKVAPAVLLAALPAPASAEGKALRVASRHDGLRLAAKATVAGVSAWRVADVRLTRQGATPYRILTWSSEAPG